MHIPDGFISVGVGAAAYAVSAGAVVHCARRTRLQLRERQVPFIGVMAAFVFAAQMINFPVAGGTSGHLLGGALLAIVLGPAAGTLALTAVLIIQALIFQDGGLLALGANVLNMAVIGVWGSHVIYTALGKLVRSKRSLAIRGFVAAWASVVLAALAAALELALSGTAPFGVVVPAMVVVHVLIGVGEGLITMGVLSFLAATRVDLLSPTRSSSEERA